MDTSKIILYAILVAIVIFLGGTWVGKQRGLAECPTMDQGTLDSLQLLRGKLQADSIQHHQETLQWQWKLDSVTALILPVQTQVANAFRRSRTLSADSLADRQLAAPPPLQ